MDIKKVPEQIKESEIIKLLNKKGVVKKLKGDGDFRSDEVKEYLKQADIVVTNPPFSLWREFVAELEEYKKDFLIIGGQNAITYKEIFPLIRDNKIWIGYGSVKEFIKPNGTKQKFGNICWYTNLDIDKRHEDLILYKTYKGNEQEYPKYDNYDAINVDKVSDIPKDYKGVMGVPITFLDKFNPKQFDIVCFRKGKDGKDLVLTRERENSTILSHSHQTTSIAGMIKNAEGKINGKPTYARITIRKKLNYTKRSKNCE